MGVNIPKSSKRVKATHYYSVQMKKNEIYNFCFENKFQNCLVFHIDAHMPDRYNHPPVLFPIFRRKNNGYYRYNARGRA